MIYYHLHANEMTTAIPKLLEDTQILQVLPPILRILHRISNNLGSLLYLQHIPNTFARRNRLSNIAKCFVLFASIGLVGEDGGHVGEV